ncbi:choline/ethanolamine kinase family protein [Roseibium album]|uniref:choline/ethanolamine kinase family protein n=1 Tax=Roseibium album TaxID=311410 RepID=UPI003BAE3BFD
MPHSVSDTPDIRRAFQVHPVLFDICGLVLRAVPQTGLSNRVYRLETNKGSFFLRLPRAETAGMVDRQAEARNIEIASGLGIALAPLFCDPASGILVTGAVETVNPEAGDLPSRLGDAVGRLHGSGKVFAGTLDADAVFNAQKLSLVSNCQDEPDVGLLDTLIRDLRLLEDETCALMPVPSHGDLSPGNCLASSGNLWLIDWEYSAMAVPAWDLAYAILEHGFSGTQEAAFLNAYRQRVPAHVPSRRQLEIMKTKCDAVSSLWAHEQLCRGSDKTDFRSFARTRRERALKRAQEIIR